MSWLPTALSIAGTALSAYGAYRQGKAAERSLAMQGPGIDFGLQGFLQQLQAQQMQHQATIAAAQFNARVSMQDAAIARDQAIAEAKQITRSNLLRLGSLRAAAGASGVTTNSFTDVIGDLVTQGELERQQALYIGDLKVRGHQIDAHLEGLRARAAYSAMSLLPAQAETARSAAAYEKYVLRERIRNQRRATKLGVATTLLGGAANAYSAYNRAYA